MTFFRVFICLLVIGCVAHGTYSQTPIDPKVVINDPPAGQPACGPLGPLCYDGTSPLVENYGNPLPFVYTGTTNLNTLSIELQNVPPPPPLIGFICQTNIWTNCEIIPLSGVAGQVDFFLSGSGVPVQGDQGTCSNCPGYLLPNASVTFDLLPTVSEMPEPASIILFGTGLSLIAAKYRRVRTVPQYTH